MQSRVLTGSKTSRAEPVHWMPVGGEPVYAAPAPDPAPASPEPGEDFARERDQARQQIQSLERRIQELEAELPRRQERGRQEGRMEGEAAGAAAAKAEVQPLMDRLATTLGELATCRARFRRESEPELLALSLAIARKILRRELSVDPHSLLGILKAALETINRAEILCIRAAPDDAQFLGERLLSLGLPDGVEVVADRGLERGSILLETKRGQIDASVHTQLAEIENGFADRIAGYNAP